MKLKTAMLAGAAAMALAGGALIAPVAQADPIPVATTYADLLEPVPDAMERVQADDARMQAQFIPAGINLGIGINLHHHHHHHHSNRWYRNHGFFWNGQVWVAGPPPYWHNHDSNWYRGRGYQWDGRGWAPDRRRFHHHHHHHHHHQSW